MTKLHECYSAMFVMQSTRPDKEGDPSFIVCPNAPLQIIVASLARNSTVLGVNCIGAHKAIAMACPVKRDCVKTKQQQSSNT